MLFLYIRFSNICLLHAGNDDRAQRMTDFQSMKNLSKAIDFAKRNLLAGNKIILVCCQNGKLTESTPAPLPPKKRVVSSDFLALRIRMPYAFLHLFVQLIEL